MAEQFPSTLKLVRRIRSSRETAALPGLHVPGVDLVKLAENFGVRARRVERYADLKGAFEQALAAEGPCSLVSQSIQTIWSLLS